MSDEADKVEAKLDLLLQSFNDWKIHVATCMERKIDRDDVYAMFKDLSNRGNTNIQAWFGGISSLATLGALLYMLSQKAV